MGEKERSSLTELSMENLPRSGYRRGQHSMRRASSPPAQSYFDTAENGPHPISPDAGSHFAYSTTLRRHESPTSTVDKIMHWSHKDPEEGIMLDNRQDAPSARYASMSIEACLRDFHSDPATGLASSSIPALRATYGYNEFSVSTPEPAWLKFAKTIYESHFILLLFGSAAISALLGNFDDAVSITVAILIVVTVGYVQEWRSEESLAALNKLVPHHCHILRDGHQVHLLANELVPGDIVTFQVGDRIPADTRILNSLDLEIDESSLTGETRPARKSDAPCPPRAPLALHSANARVSHLWAPSFAMVSPLSSRCAPLTRPGRGTGLVVSTGATTKFGSVFTLMQSVEEKRTPLQASMSSRTSSPCSALGQVSLAVAAIPDLPIVTTVTLALGVLRMARRKAIVKKLPSVEALGSVSVVCSDKTGKYISQCQRMY
ncbi:Calcium-transporting P-type ATPase, PMR1-type protein [Ceratobasidium theobromae]|uniref:Calcium-transporting P-type ATPase, PMR1-type protein n=1 Tax=Ceratobasidium theobromae TaxID=1582974 RepID=A0A5N5QLW0_9AGAM|nr:Calcium-transporting P-type ATPase, PMR1-type protein [Ceratobasidium theobromae]